MKSKKFVSLLLTAALALSSAPMMMAVDEAETTNILDLAESAPEGEALFDGAATGNQYLHVGDRNGNRDSGMQYNIGALSAGTYYVSFYGRLSTPFEAAEAPAVTTQASALKQQALRVPAGLSGTYNVVDENGDPVLNEDGTQKTAAVVNAVTGNNYWAPISEENIVSKTGTTAIKLTEDWTKYEFQLTLDHDAAGSYFKLYAYQDSRYFANFDIDEFKFYTKDEDGNEVPMSFFAPNSSGVLEIMGYARSYLNFDDNNDIVFGGHNVSNTNSTGHRGRISYNSYASLSIVEESDFVRLPASETNDCTDIDSYVYDFGEDGVVLNPGVYQLNGDFRYGTTWINVLSDLDGYGGTKTDDANPLKNGAGFEGITYDGITYPKQSDTKLYESAVNVAIRATIDGEELVLAEFKADGEWIANGSEPITLPEGGVLTSLVIETTNVATNEALVNAEKYPATPDAPLDVKGLSLVAIDPYISKSDFDGAEETNHLYDAVVTTNGDYEYIEDNNYLYAPQRPNGENSFINFILDETPVAGRTYYLGFDIYNDEYAALGRFNFRPKIISSFTAVSPACDMGILGGLSQRWFWYNENNETATAHSHTSQTLEGGCYPGNYAVDSWQYYEGQITAAADNANKIKVSFDRGPSSGFKQAFKLDNMKVWYFDETTGDKVVIYDNDFSDGTVGDITEEIDNFALEVRNDGGYATVTAIDAEPITVTYDVSDIADRTGDYTFAADVSVDAVVTFTYKDGTPVEGYEASVTDAANPIVSITVDTEATDEITIADAVLDFVKTAPSSGDVSGDDKITPLDLTYFQRYLADWNGYAERKVVADSLDVNNDGSVDFIDATILARHIAKWNGYDNLEDAKLNVDTANDSYVFIRNLREEAYGAALNVGLSAGYVGEYYCYAETVDEEGNVTKVSGAFDLNSGEFLERIYSPVKLSANRVYRINEDGVIYTSDSLAYEGELPSEGTHYAQAHWLSRPVTGAKDTFRNYVKYGITDAYVDKENRVNYTDYAWYIDEANNTLAEGAEKTAVELAREEYRAQLIAIIKAEAAESSDDNYADIVAGAKNRENVKAFLAPYIELEKADIANGTSGTWEESFQFEAIPETVEGIELIDDIIDVTYDEATGYYSAVLPLGGYQSEVKTAIPAGTVLFDESNRITKLVVVNQEKLDVWEGERAIEVLETCPEIAWIGMPTTDDEYNDLYNAFLADGVAVFMVGYNNTDR